MRRLLACGLLLSALGGCSAAAVARRETIRRVIEEDEARRNQYAMAEAMRCAQMEVLPPGQAPARPMRVIEAAAIEAQSQREAEEQLRQHACQLGGDVVLDMRREDEGTTGRDVKVAITPTSVKVKTPNRNVSVGLGPQTYRFAATIAAFKDGSSILRGTLSIDLTGPGASPGKVTRCVKAINKIGSKVSASAPVRAVLTLNDEDNQLQVVTQQGVLLDEPRPDWNVDRLCQNAAVTALQTYQRSAK